MERFGKSLRRFARCRSGATAIEFAFVFPLVLGTMCGIMFFSVYLFNAHRLDTSAREIARDFMLVESPTEAGLQTMLQDRMASYDFPNEAANVAVTRSADGTRYAVLTISMDMANKTPFLDTSGMKHGITLRTPIREEDN